MLRAVLIAVLAVLSACATPPLPAPEPVTIPEDSALAGSWERDYARDDDVNQTLQRAYNALARSLSDRQRIGGSGAALPSNEARALVGLARLVEKITRPDVLRILQDGGAFDIEREDDFTLSCRFEDGVAVPIQTIVGAETCRWDSGDLISRVLFLEGLQVQQRFTVSQDGFNLRVTTTAVSPDARTPFTLRRFYRRFKEPEPEYACVETLTMKRVCTTGELEF